MAGLGHEVVERYELSRLLHWLEFWNERWAEASVGKFNDEIVGIICYKFSMNIWLSRKDAAAKISVSVETIDRRALAWQKEPMPNRIRYKLLKLGDDTRKQRRFYEPDIEAMLVMR